MVSDTGAGLVAGRNCAGAGTQVTCSPVGVTEVFVDSGDAADGIANTTALPITINAGTGDDALTGGAGNDQLRGNAGADTIRGGAGNDTIVTRGDVPDAVGRAPVRRLSVDRARGVRPIGVPDRPARPDRYRHGIPAAVRRVHEADDLVRAPGREPVAPAGLGAQVPEEISGTRSGASSRAAACR